MFTKILEMLNPTVYKDKYFIIKKDDEFSYSIKAKNGLYGTINVFNNTMFVAIFVKPQQFLTRYSTSLTDATVSIETAMIDNIRNNILFKIQETLVDSMIRNNYAIFRSNQSATVHPSELLIGTHFDACYYPNILFSKKKVVKNIYRYSFETVRLNDLDTSISQYYMVGEYLFAVSDLDHYLDLVIDSSKFGGLVSLGIDNQLTDDVELYKKYLNTSNVLMLSRSSVSYCHIKRERRKLMIVYFDNFHDHSGKSKADSSFINIFKHGHQFYKFAQMVSITWHKGKVTTQQSSFDKELAKKHEKDISNMVKDGFDILQLKHPSKTVLNTLSELGLPDSLPLSRETLTVVDMYQI
jgi:hypothetical protein